MVIALTRRRTSLTGLHTPGGQVTWVGSTPGEDSAGLMPGQEAVGIGPFGHDALQGSSPGTSHG